MSKYPKGYEEIFEQLDKEYEEEQEELTEIYRDEITEKINKISDIDILRYISASIGGIIEEERCIE